MIERIPFLKLVFPNSIENKYVIHKDCASAIFNKINELVDHANKMDLALQKNNEIYEKKLLTFSKTLNEMTKTVFPNIGLSASDFLANGKETKPKFGEWVSVKDKLPPKYESILMVIPGDAPFPDIKKGFVDGYGMWIADNHCREKGEISHWMPMPNLPEEFTPCVIAINKGGVNNGNL